VGIAIRRTYLDPPSAVLEFVIHSDTEPQILNVESKASLLIADENDHKVKTEVRVVAIQP
jgi:hypothetical protein